MPGPRVSPQTEQVLEVFLKQPMESRYGYDITRQTGLKAGTLYPILMRLTKHRLLQAEWVIGEDGTPPRHMYRLTAKGARFAEETLSRLKSRDTRLRRPETSKGHA